MRPALLAMLLGIALAPSAIAQTAARQPEWARPLLANDPEAIRVTGATLTAPKGGVAVRVTVAPSAGGVARVLRFSSDGKTGSVSMLRFTGHARNGWNLWGSEAPTEKAVTGAALAQLDALARRALQQSAYGGDGSETAAVCSDGALVFVEASDNARALSTEKRCTWSGASGALAKAISDAAGSRDEAELVEAAIEEILVADRAFAKLASEKGIAVASAAFAAEGVEPLAAKAEGKLSWAPSGAEVAARGDLAYSWGRWSREGAAAASGQYLSVWRRSADGAWKYAARLES